MGQPGWLGSLRVAGLYMAGVTLGALGASSVQPDKYLVGASAGVYALIAAHLGNETQLFVFIGFGHFNQKDVFSHFNLELERRWRDLPQTLERCRRTCPDELESLDQRVQTRLCSFVCSHRHWLCSGQGRHMKCAGHDLTRL